MYKQLIEDISYDLDIKKYPGEDKNLYHSRIVYSAISLWMKYIILDHMVLSDEFEVKSKNYHYRRISEILDEYINIFPEISPWMSRDYTTNPIHIIRNRLIAAGEINEIDLDGNITLAKKKTIPLDEKISRLIEISTQNTNFKYVGITKIINDENESGLGLMIENSLDLAKEFNNPSYYSELSKINFEYESFNFHKKNKYEKNWISNKKLDLEINLIRKKTNTVNYWDYLLILKQFDKLFQYPLKEELIKQGFHNRLILGIKKLYDNPSVARYKRHENIIELRLDNKLPKYEESLLMTYSWPKNHILDSWSYIVPIEIWNRVTEVLKTLGYEMEENLV